MENSPINNALTADSFDLAITRLCALQPSLDAVVVRYGRPPFWHRAPGFRTLLQIILEQQVSLSSARQTFRRLERAVRPLTPARLVELDDDAPELIAAGLTRQKRRYCRALAAAIVDDGLQLSALSRQHDDRVRARLTAIRGIGPWTADVYLLTALRRPDLWPVGDLALVLALQEVYRLPQRPAAELARRYGEPLRPLRSVAVRLLWHHYLRSRGRDWDEF